jgi:hypothetical protein
MINLYLPFYGIELKCDNSDHIEVLGKRFVSVHHKRTGLDNKLFTFYLDERDNTIDIHTSTEMSKKLEEKFNEFKNSNINYGNIGSGSEYEYDGTENILLKDFFEYLKSENRESIINQSI